MWDRFYVPRLDSFVIGYNMVQILVDGGRRQERESMDYDADVRFHRGELMTWWGCMYGRGLAGVFSALSKPIYNTFVEI